MAQDVPLMNVSHQHLAAAQSSADLRPSSLSHQGLLQQSPFHTHDHELGNLEYSSAGYSVHVSSEDDEYHPTAYNGVQNSASVAPYTLNNFQPMTADPQEWISTWLKIKTLTCLGVLTLALMAAVIGLTIQNELNEGIVFVDLQKRQGPQLIPDLRIGIGLLWTFVPVLIFQLYGLLIDGVIQAALDRQPYVELGRQSGSIAAPAEKSICLDYRSHWVLAGIYKAYELNHYTLCLCMCLSLVVKILLSPIASHLFFTTPSAVLKSVDLRHTSFFNYSGFGADSSITPVLDIVSATRVYGGRPIPWTTLDETLLPFSSEQLVSTVTFTVTTQAMAATADCRLLGPDEFSIADSNNGLEFNITDRDCSITSQLYTPKVYPRVRDYVQTYTYSTCPSFYNSSRIVAISAHNGNASAHILTNVFAVSCIPLYYQYTTNATLDTTDVFRPGVLNTKHAADLSPFEQRPPFAVLFERDLNQAGVIDATSPIYATNFGRIILQYGATMPPTNLSYLSGDKLLTATQNLFTSAFAIAANRYLISPNTSASDPNTQLAEVQASYPHPKARVRLVLPIAISILVILTLILIALIRVHTYTAARPSILYEEPIGLLSAATILRGSDLLNDVSSIAGKSRDGKVAAEFREALRAARDRGADSGGWAYEKWEDPGAARLAKTGLSRGFGMPEAVAEGVGWLRRVRKKLFR